MDIITEKVTPHKIDDAQRVVEKAPVGIITFNDDFVINYCNEYVIKSGNYYGLDFTSLYNLNLLNNELIPGVSLKEEILDLQSGYSFEKELRLDKTNLGGITFVVKGSPLLINQVFAGGILVIEDLQPGFFTGEETGIKSDYYEKIINRVHDLLFITDAEGKVKYSYGKKLRKLNQEVVSDFEIKRIFSDSAQTVFATYIENVKLKRRSEKINLELFEGNEKHIYECRIEPLLNKRGQIQFIFFFLNDITELIQHNENLAKQLNELKQFQLIAETISDSAIAVDAEGKILFWNRASEKLFGFSKTDVLGKFFGKSLGLFDEEYFETVKIEINKNKSWKINLSLYKNDRTKEVIEARFSYVQSNNLIVILFNNITDRVNLEKQLKDSEEKFRIIVGHTDDLICNLEPDGTISYVNEKFLLNMGYSEKELYGTNFRELIDKKFYGFNKFDLREFKNSPERKLELPLLSKNGSVHYFKSKFTPVFFENKTVKYYNGFLFDISSVKRAESDLYIFKTLFEASQDGIAVEADGKIMLSNSSFATIFGYERKEEMINKEILDIVSSNDSIKVSEYFQMIEQDKDVPGRFEFLGRKKDNSSFYTEVTPAVFDIDGKNYVVIVARDVTERKRAQQAIRESEEKYRNITENIDDFLFTYEKIGRFLRPVFYTASVEKITGYTQSDVLSDSRFILKIIHPDDFGAVKRKMKIVMKSRIQVSEELEFRMINRHGNIVWVRARINIARTVDRRIQRIYGLVSDITLRKKAEEELNKSTENLVKLNETKDKFISIISHDLRTPFSSILGFTDLLIGDEGLTDKEKKQYIRFIQESSKSMLALVNSLLDWTRLQTGRIKFEPERISAVTIIDDSINALSGTAYQKQINLYSDVDPSISIFVDKNLIMQVFNNLISNAIKFSMGGGEIKISATPAAKTRFYEFSIKDNGIGIKEENLANLFRIDTKFTSEGTAGEKGSGLGLSLVKEIVEKHGGTIRVNSIFGKGTEFIFSLPIASATILLVDDSKTDRLLYSKILKNITPDYSIEIASNGNEALEKIYASPPALVITDHFMPEMNGYELVLELKRSELKGKPPVIILSGDIDRNAIHDYNEIGIEYVFHKPVNLSSFKLAVEKSLRKGLSN